MPVLSNLKHEKFAQALARGLSPRDAVVSAGMKFDRSYTSKLMKNTAIRTRVEELMRPALTRAAMKTEIGVDRLVEELEAVAVAQITDVLEWGETIAVQTKKGERLVYGVKVRSLDDIPHHVRAAISEVRQTKDGITIKMHDKLRSIELLGRFRRMWGDKDKDEGEGDKATLLELLNHGFRDRDRLAKLAEEGRLIEGMKVVNP